MMAELLEELRKKGISLMLSRVQAPAHAMMDRLGVSEKIGKENFHSRTLFAVSHYLTGEGASKLESSELLPDMVKCVHGMVCDWVAVVEGNERERLIAVQSQFETILKELGDITAKSKNR